MRSGAPSRPAVGPEVRMMPTPTVSPITAATPKASPRMRSRLLRPGVSLTATLDTRYPLSPAAAGSLRSTRLARPDYTGVDGQGWVAGGRILTNAPQAPT